jgi:hypothetical protein
VNTPDSNKRQTKIDKRASALRDNLKKRKAPKKPAAAGKQEKD